MTDIKIKNHKLYDSLLNREYLVQKELPKLEADKSISTTEIKTAVPEARSCPNSATCLWGHVVKAGGTPCDKCRHLVKGDYFKTEAMIIEKKVAELP